MALRTSATHPLRIDEVPCPPQAPGTIGVTFCPGKQGDSVFGAGWRRDLDADLDVIQQWRAQLALTLIERHELEMLGVPKLGDAFASRGIAWHHLPIRDLATPAKSFERLWATSGQQAVALLREGARVLVHCRGGLGRAGTVACMLLIELGESQAGALRRVRAARPGAVETLAQERFLAGYVGQFGATSG
jgi:ADP-ribosyl-[dinitrogen reductase] hydrolase